MNSTDEKSSGSEDINLNGLYKAHQAFKILSQGYVSSRTIYDPVFFVTKIK